MTRDEWLSSADPAAMLQFFREGAGGSPPYLPGGLPSDRKLRLFACACVRQVWHLLTDDCSRRAVETAERYADGLVTRADFLAASEVTAGCLPYNLVWNAFRPDAASSALNVINHLTFGQLVTSAFQAALLREVHGDPFAPVKRIVYDNPRCPNAAERHPGIACTCPPWLIPNVMALARAAYEERPGLLCERCKGEKIVYRLCRQDEKYDVRDCPDCRGTGLVEDGALAADRLAVLADALEEAGCDNADLLAHLRGPGPHVRGCWALDTMRGVA